MSVKVVIYNGGNSINITNLVKSVEWTGDIKTLPRSINVELKNVNDIKGHLLVQYNLGNLVIFYKDNIELFRGFIFTRSMSNSGDESFTAYDELVYTTKNSDDIFVKNKSASDIIISECKKFGIAIGSIESTGHKISKLVFTGAALNEIFEDCLDETRKYTKKSYKIYSKQGKVYMVSREKAQKSTIKITDVITSSRDISIEDTKTQVLVTKGSIEGDGEVKYSTYTAKDSAKANLYGVMQHVETVDDKTSYDAMKKKATSILAGLSSIDDTLSIDFIGDVNCITGNKIDIYDDLSGAAGSYYITSDKHNFSDGTYKMSLQLSKKLS